MGGSYPKHDGKRWRWYDGFLGTFFGPSFNTIEEAFYARLLNHGQDLRTMPGTMWPRIQKRVKADFDEDREKCIALLKPFVDFDKL